jgi:hypothetical protein
MGDTIFRQTYLAVGFRGMLDRWGWGPLRYNIYIYKDISEASQPLEVETDTSSVEMDSCFLGGSWILTTWIETVHTEAVISYSLLWYRNGLFNSMIYLRW